MCRNITEFRGLEPPATEEEIEAAAYQFVRKITGVTKPTGAVHDDMHAVALEIAALAHDLLDRLPRAPSAPEDGAAAAPPRGPGAHGAGALPRLTA